MGGAAGAAAGSVGPGCHRRRCGAPPVMVVVVEHRDRLAGFGTGQLDALVAAAGRQLLAADPGATSDDLARDMTEVLASLCARRYGRRGARNRVLRAGNGAWHAGVGAGA